MATNTEQRLFCLGPDVVIMEGDEVVSVLNIDESQLKQEILQQIKNSNSRCERVRPAVVFSKALENMTGIRFKHLGYKTKIKKLSIHESIFYRQFLGFICEAGKFSELIAGEKKLVEEARKNSYFFEKQVKRNVKKAKEDKRRKN